MTDEQFAELLRTLQDNDPSFTDWMGAIAGALTFVVAVIALRIARGQLKEASDAREQTKKLEREKSQPYVVAFLEENAVGSHILDLVVRNYGQTAGRNIRLSFEPTLNRTDGNGGEEDVILPEVISFLAPGQEWRTLFDVATERAHREDLPMVYKGVVTYDGIDGDPQTSDEVIDLQPFKARIFTEVLGVHHAARALQDIRDNQKRWTEFNSLRVVARDGDAKDARNQQFRRERQAERAAKTNPHD
ncbi:UNVERIFIED_ORG: hypothetical protein J2X79_002049 [Arthrobacter globiformis]|nr:hypothetical protein [Arthrobacter globiformis]